MTSEEKIRHGQFLIHGDWYDNAAFRYTELYSEKKNPILEEKYKPGKLGISRRVLSHWRELKLVESTGFLSLRDLFWIKLIMEVRKFGMSLKKIILMKESLLATVWIVPYLDLFLTLKLANPKKDFYILVYPDGQADIGAIHEIEFSELSGYIKHGYIKISLQTILNSLFKGDDMPITNRIRLELDGKEVDILENIRNGEYEEIVIKLKNGDITRIKKKEVRDPSDAIAQIRSLVKDVDYGEITLKLKDGKIVHFENQTSN